MKKKIKFTIFETIMFTFLLSILIVLSGIVIALKILGV